MTHQRLTGTLENVAHILTRTRLWVPTNEPEMVGLLDTLNPDKENQNKTQQLQAIPLDLCILSSNTNDSKYSVHYLYSMLLKKLHVVGIKRTHF